MAASASSNPTAAPSNTSSSYNYQVFLNHHGGDVKKTFASHLYHFLKAQGFRVFLDQSEMQVGDEIDPQLRGAIATASVHIAIFSLRYAESKWCLKELDLMLNSMDSRATKIIPVFYNVLPSDLQVTQGGNKVYGPGLCNLEKIKKYEPYIPIWKKALYRVSKLIGFELTKYNGDEGELMVRVAQRVKEIIVGEIPPLHVAQYPTGLDKKLEDFQKTVLLEQQQHKEGAKVLGIVGPCGVGKTTLATEYFNRNTSAYSGSCVLFDVRETPLISLQNKLLKDLTILSPNIDNIPDGIAKLSRHLQGYHVLIILDSVDNDEQLNALFSPIKGILSSDSMILVTSRNKEALTGIAEASIYKLEGLDEEYSRQLFCWHAFKQPNLKLGFEDYVQRFLEISDGLPLSLRELGMQAAKLIKKPWDLWDAQLRKLSGSVLPAVIEKRLKVTYEGLEKEEKEIFLDIACFFIEEKRENAIRIWDVSGLEGRLNLENLENKFLLEIDSENCIRMHHHIRNLGRGLAEKELPRGFHRRIWNPNEKLSYNVFHQPIVRGINRVEGISDQLIDSHHRVDMSQLRLLKAEGYCLESISNLVGQSDLLWLCWDTCQYTFTSPPWIPTRKLEVFKLNGVEQNLLRHGQSEVKLNGDEQKLLRHGQSEPPLMLEHNEKIETKDSIEQLGKDFSPPLMEAALETLNNNGHRYQILSGT